MIANRWFSDSILSWVIAKINANCKNTLAFSFLEEFQGSSWNEALVHRFQEKFLNHQPSTLIIFLNFGRYSEKSGNSMKHTTFIGEYDDREQKRYTTCHYSLLVYSFKNSKCFYCDSLGWSKPIFIFSYVQELILLLKNEAVLIDIIECHYNDTNIRSLQVQKHKCTQGKCAYTKRKENGNSSSLRCKRVLSPSRNKQTNKKIKLKFFDTESHSRSNSSHPSKFNFSSTLEKDTKIQKILENSEEKDFQKPTQRAHTKSNISLCDAKYCSKDLKRDSSENNREQFSSLHFIHLSQLEDADPLLYTEICDRRLCTKLVNHFHCKLCSGNVSFQRSYYILRHIKQVHLNQNHYVTHDSVVCLPCRCDILPLASASRKTNHYHCPKCIAIVKQKGHFLQHLKNHLIKRKKSLKEKKLFSSPAEQKQSPKEKELSSRSTKTSEEPNIVKNKSSPQNRGLSNVALRV